MSFFNTLQQYVTNSVASLNISPRRFSVSRENEEPVPKVDQPQPPPPPPPLKMSAPSVGNRSPSAVHRSSAHLLQERSKSLKTVSSHQPPSPRRAGGGRTASLHPIDCGADRRSHFAFYVDFGSHVLSNSSHIFIFIARIPFDDVFGQTTRTETLAHFCTATSNSSNVLASVCHHRFRVHRKIIINFFISLFFLEHQSFPIHSRYPTCFLLVAPC